MWAAGLAGELGAAWLGGVGQRMGECGEGCGGSEARINDDHCPAEVGRAWLLLSVYETWRGRGPRLGTRGFEVGPEGEC